MQRFKEAFHYFFVPSEKNNLRAKGLHHDFLTFYFVIALTLFFLAKGPLKNVTHNVLGYATDISIPKLYQLTNEERQKNSLSSLSYNQELANAATKKAQDMFTKNYWAHYAPDGTTPWNFILSSGYQYEFAGENLAKNFLFSQNVVDAWMTSPTHRENILRSQFADVGFAVVNGVLNGEETTLVVQMFGKPAGASVAKAPVAQQAAATPTPTTSAVAQAQPPQPVSLNNSPLVLAQQQTKPTVNLFHLSFNATYIFLSLLLIILATDFYFASKFKVIRFHSKNLAHVIFVFMIIMGLVLFLSKGVIL